MSQFQQDYDYTFKLAITGNSSVGKSSLLIRFSDDFYNETLIPTIGVDFKIRSITVDNKIVKLNIWDTAGQERFDAIIKAYYKGIHACIIVFDLTDRQSFIDVQKWHDKYKQNARPDVRLILIGNKADLTQYRAVSYEEAMELATELNINYIETSAKTKQNVDECFISLSRELVASIAPKKVVGDNEQKEKIKLKPGQSLASKKSTQLCC